MNQKKQLMFSIVIPVYNGEKYIKRSITSILHQTYSNFEIVIVNDGSTDNSLLLCQKFANTDSRVKVISQNNCGSAKARRVGIENALGDYIMFVDVDDYLCQKNAIEIVEKYISRYDVDLLQFSFQKKLRFVSKKFPCTTSILLQNKTEFMENQYPMLLGSYYAGSILTASMYDKVYRKTLFDNVISSRDTNYIFVGDDVYLNLHILQNVNSAVFIPNCLYSYQALTGGTKRYSKQFMDDYQIVKDNQLDFINKYSHLYHWKQNMEYYCHAETAWCVYSQILRITKHFSKEEALTLISECFEYDWVKRAINYFQTVNYNETYLPTLEKINMLVKRDVSDCYSKALESQKKKDIKYYIRKFL